MLQLIIISCYLFSKIVWKLVFKIKYEKSLCYSAFTYVLRKIGNRIKDLDFVIFKIS